MTFEEKTQNSYGELLVTVYIKIRDTFASTKLQDQLTNDTLDFKTRIMNIRRLKRIATNIEDLIDSPQGVVDHTLVTMRRDMIDLGQSPGIARDVQKTILQIVEVVDSGQGQLQDYDQMVKEAFCQWYDALATDTVGFTAFKLLYESYKGFAYKRGGLILNPKRFASVLRTIGAKPGVVDIDNVTTRVYKGIGLKS